MKKNLIILVLTSTIVACTNVQKTNKDLSNQLDSVSYSLGVSVANNLKSSGFDEIRSAAISTAFDDVFSENEMKISEEDANVIIQQYFTEMSKRKNQQAISQGKEFLEENAQKEGVITTASGLQYQVLVEGQGAMPSAKDEVTVHYHGTLIDGTVFDSSVDRGEPTTFPVNGVISGWQEALQLMKVGSKYKLFIPSDLAYGERGAGGVIGPNSTLIFEVELLSILN